jgi:dihydroxyacetone kinase
VDKSKKKITVEDFLDHLSEQKSVSGKEKLGVRVQSLGYVPVMELLTYSNSTCLEIRVFDVLIIFRMWFPY